MKFTIAGEQLQEGLRGVAAAIPAKTTLPVLANVLVEAAKPGLRLSGTDLDIAVSTTVLAEVDTEGAVTLPAKKLVDIVRELPGGPVRVTAAGEARVSLECGRAKFKLLGLPREEFPSRGRQARGTRDVRRIHGGESADPERRAVGAAGRSHAHGRDERPPARQDGRAG